MDRRERVEDARRQAQRKQEEADGWWPPTALCSYHSGKRVACRYKKLCRTASKENVYAAGTEFANDINIETELRRWMDCRKLS